MRIRVGLALLFVVAATGLATAAPAAALNCAGFKSALANPPNGATITLDAGLTCHDRYDLPGTNAAPYAITIQGAGAGATLDGAGLGDAIIRGITQSGKQLGVTIRNLTFRNGAAAGSGGGAIILGVDGVSATLDRDRFFHNTSAGQLSAGGAVRIQSRSGSKPLTVMNSTFGDGTPAGANTAPSDGAIQLLSYGTGPSIVLKGNTFRGNVSALDAGAAAVSIGVPGRTATVTGNTFVGNTAHDQAGALTLDGKSATLRRNRFVGNRVDHAVGDHSFGGAVLARAFDGGTLTQSGNVFARNSITRGPKPAFDVGGGGEWVAGLSLTSRGDRFTNNSIPAAAGSGEAEGAGLGIEGCSGGSAPRTTSRVDGAVVAGNRGAPGVHGAGLYAGGCNTGPVDLIVRDSTIAGNSTSGAGAVAGLFGGPDDSLVLRNSIVAGNVGAVNLAGFGAGRAVRHSDACGPAVLPGAGNICAKPRLKSPNGNVHETAVSPTIDRGAKADIAPGLKTDIDGGARILGAAVDMGADEFRPRDDPFRSARLVGKQTVVVEGGVAKVRVRCPPKVPGPCAGDLALKRKGSKLGHHSFSIGRGHGELVPVELSGKGRDALAADGKLTVTAIAKATDALGTKRKSSAKVKLKAG